MTRNAVAVVTGGCGEFGLETAKLLARDHHVVLSDTSRERLHRALDELDSLGVSAESIVADVTNRRAVEVLMEAASSAGHVATVIHAGGTTSASDSPDTIIRTRVLGTINVTAATLAVAGIGTTLVHTTARSTPTGPLRLPRWGFQLAPTHPDGLAAALVRLATLAPTRLAPSLAHMLSETFVDWYTERMARVFAASGARLHLPDRREHEAAECHPVPTFGTVSTLLGSANVETVPKVGTRLAGARLAGVDRSAPGVSRAS